MVSVWKVCTIARNSEAEMVIEGSNVVGATDETTGVVGGAVEVALGMGTIVGDVGVGGTVSVGSSSCYAWSAYGGTRSAGMGGALTGA